MLQTLKVGEVQHSLEGEIKALEDELDMQEYYQIKRPTIVFFNKAPLEKRKLIVVRYDILSG